MAVRSDIEPDRYAGTGLAVRSLAMVAMVALCAALLHDRIATIDGGEMWRAIGQTPALAVLGALVLGGLSHAALAGYDILAMTRIGRHVPTTRALKGGFCGTVFGQVLGLGLLTGSFARFRIYRSNRLGMGDVVALSGYVTAGFFSGLSVLLLLLCVIDPTLVAGWSMVSPDLVRAGAAALLAGLGGLCLLAPRLPGVVPLGRLQVRPPDGGWLLVASVLAAADLIPAALCLYVLMPDGSGTSLAGFIAIYVAAVALGHMTSSPGAVGPFEGVLFLALPGVPATELAAAVLVYRAVYYLPPFLLAIGFVARARASDTTDVEAPGRLRDRVAWTLDTAGQAEGELVFLGDKQVFYPADGAGFVMYAAIGRTWLVMGDPVGPPAAWPALMDAFFDAARQGGARVAVYKATCEAADFWRARGWHLQPIGHDGLLRPGSFSLDGPERRELRRKRAQAARAGVRCVVHGPGTAPLDRLGAVATTWRAARKGREQSFSMGHWDPDFVARHHVIEARVDDRTIAFVTLWVSGDGSEWMLDLMRHGPDMPNGTMQTLISEAILTSAAAGAARFNLCMAPLSGLSEQAPTRMTRLLALIYDRLDRWHGLKGLRRFKETFRPDWAPRYVAVRRARETVPALLAAARLINRRLVRAQAGFRPMPAPDAALFDDAALAGDAASETAACHDHPDVNAADGDVQPVSPARAGGMR